MTTLRLHTKRPLSDAASDRPESGTASVPNSTAQTLRSEDLMRGQAAIAIAHNGALYRLQTTRQGKLILTK